MSIDHPITIGLLAAYLLGSIPFGYLLIRIILGSDVRQTGSGNIGATNVSRTSPVLGVFTLLLDVCKGLAAVAVALFWLHGTRQLAFACAFAAICGHVFPVWLGFRGGKGVATGLGSLILLAPKTVLISIALFITLVAAFRWVALGSIAASACLPVFASLLKEARNAPSFGAHSAVERAHPVWWLAAGALLIVLKHHSNIRRLLAGTEPRFRWTK